MKTFILFAAHAALFIAAATPFSHAADQQLLLVSDIDDTLKITHVDDKDRAVWNGVFTTRAFAGMAELYRGIVQDTGAEVVYLSSSPAVLRPRIADLLRKNGFPAGMLVLRTLKSPRDRREYKLDALNSLAQITSASMILVGDDTQQDPEIYEEFMRSHPAQVASIHIRRIRARALPAPAQGFYSSFQLGASEYLAGRLKRGNALGVGRALLAARRGFVLPEFAACPEEYTNNLPVELMDMEFSINEKLQGICNSRRN